MSPTNNAVVLEIPHDTPETDERCRSIERGAKLVTVMPSIFALVMQMPRGNLETIYPRALVLAGIRKNIIEKKYKKAFLACRNHRVDMNILHDHAPQIFMEDVALFVDQIKKVEHIDLFLSHLRYVVIEVPESIANWDIGKKMYHKQCIRKRLKQVRTSTLIKGKQSKIEMSIAGHRKLIEYAMHSYKCSKSARLPTYKT